MKPCSKHRKPIALLALSLKSGAPNEPPSVESQLQPAQRNCNVHGPRVSPSGLDTVSDPSFQHLISHIQTCPGCLQYFNELSTVTTFLTSTSDQPYPDLEATESFHRRVVDAIRDHPRFIPRDWLLTIADRLHFRPQPLRIALPALVAVAAVVFVMLTFHHSPKPSPSTAAHKEAQPQPPLPPTVANYQAVANRSLDQLDDLLTLQANKPQHSVPIYTASLFSTTAIPE
jgi:hypothetical protein